MQIGETTWGPSTVDHSLTTPRRTSSRSYICTPRGITNSRRAQSSCCIPNQVHGRRLAIGAARAATCPARCRRPWLPLQQGPILCRASCAASRFFDWLPSPPVAHCFVRPFVLICTYERSPHSHHSSSAASPAHTSLSSSCFLGGLAVTPSSKPAYGTNCLLTSPTLSTDSPRT